ncbi:MAG: ribokinase [Anaerolineaceae bacterium]|nr:MAG: ribokinase [Anaerolineaceae bacterium]
MRILNFGSLNIDFVYDVNHFVRGGETLSSMKLEKFCGGKGLNQSLALARAGANVYHAGCVGADGEMLIDTLKNGGVNCNLIETINEVSGHAIIQVDKNGENCILLYGGANNSITVEQIDKVLGNFGKGDYILLQNEINNLDIIIDRASQLGLKIVLNPSPISDNLKKLPLNKISYFLLNEIEGKELTDKEDPDEILKELRSKYPESIIVLTLGSKGAIYDDGSKRCSHGIYDVDVVDTTAAGDTFTGYFIHEITSGTKPEDALEMAAKAAALAVSRMGASPSIPMRKEVLEAQLRLKNNGKG